MAIAHDATTNMTSFGNVASYTFNHTCTGTDRCLFVGLQDSYTGASPTVSVTYNSVSMDFIAQVITGSAARSLRIFSLLNPASGTNTVAVTIGGQASVENYGGAASFTGVKQDQTLPDASGTGNATAGTTVSATVTTTVTNCWAFYVFGNNGTTAGTNASVLSITSGRGFGVNSTQPIASAGAYAMTMNKTSGANCGMVAVSFKPAPAAAAPSGGSFLFNMM